LVSKGVGVDAKEILAAALAAVEDAKIPEHLQPIAFERAIDLLTGGSRPLKETMAANGSASPEGRLGTPEPAADRGDSTDAIQRIANKLNVDRELVDEVFHEEDGAIKIMVAARKFPTSRQAAMQQIALLVCAGRQGAGQEVWTATDEIRAVVDDMGRLDSPNFSRAISEMEDQFGFSGSTRKRKLRLKRQGWDAAGDLIRSLAGGAS
jgi:hypothetical protein